MIAKMSSQWDAHSQFEIFIFWGLIFLQLVTHGYGHCRMVKIVFNTMKLADCGVSTS